MSAPGPSPAGADPDDVHEAYENLMAATQAAKEMRKQYDAELRLANRLRDAKIRRFMAAVDSGKGSASKALERYHMAETEHMKARYEHAWGWASAAETEREAYKALVAALGTSRFTCSGTMYYWARELCGTCSMG